jgi:integrase
VRAEPPARLEVFTVEQIEALARAAESGAWRGPHNDLTDMGSLARAEEDAEFGELLRVAAYTGLRRGELVALRWHDVRWAERVLVVERALSGDVEGTTKGGRVRYVPLGDQALGALDRLSRRPNFTSADDYVFATIAGDRPDPSALRRRYIAARDAAGLPPLRFHDLRHTAGTLLTRVLDPVTVRDVLGHADLKTTERYLHAIRASRLAEAATAAFTPAAVEPAGPREAAVR